MLRNKTPIYYVESCGKKWITTPAPSRSEKKNLRPSIRIQAGREECGRPLARGPRSSPEMKLTFPCTPNRTEAPREAPPVL